MKRLLFLFLTSTAICHAQDAAPTPDYKAMYLKANEAAAGWKTRATACETKLTVSEDRARVAEATLKNNLAWMKALKRQQTKLQETAERNVRERIDKLDPKGYVLARGKVISATDNGLLLDCKADFGRLDMAKYAVAYHITTYFDGICFVEMPSDGYLDNQVVTVRGVKDGTYEYTNALNAPSRVQKVLACIEPPEFDWSVFSMPLPGPVPRR